MNFFPPTVDALSEKKCHVETKAEMKIKIRKKMTGILFKINIKEHSEKGRLGVEKLNYPCGLEHVISPCNSLII